MLPKEVNAKKHFEKHAFFYDLNKKLVERSKNLRAFL